MVSLAPLGVGTVWEDHVVPFQLSTKLEIVPLVLDRPAAIHTVAEVHDTLYKSVDVPTFTPFWVAHSVPFHRSIKVSFWAVPTAVQAVDDVHDTPSKTLSSVGLGVD